MALETITDMTPAPFRAPKLSPQEQSAVDLRTSMVGPAQAKEAELIKSQGEFEAALKADEATRTAARERAKRESILTEKQAIEASPEFKNLRSIEEQAMNSQFIPSQENAQDLATLFGLVSAIGFAIGVGGKGSAMQAMSAMNGMLEGHQQGRADLYKRQKDIFDENLKVLRQKSELLRNRLTDIAKLAATDRQAADAEADALFAEQGATFLKNNKDKFGLASALKLAQANVKSAEEAYKIVQKQREDAEKKRQDALKLMPYSEPFMASDGKVYVLNKQSGMMQQVNLPEGTTLTKAGGVKGKDAGKAAGGQDRYGFANIVATNLNEAVGSINNIVSMPESSTTGYFQGQNTKGLLFAPLGVMANKLTSEDVQRYNVELSNFGKSVARVISGGRVVPATVQADYENQFKVREGDSPLTVMTKIGQMRQAIERAAEVYIASSSTDENLKGIYRKALSDIAVAIPFTVADVNRFANERDKNVTFSDMFKRYGMGGSQQAAPSQPQQPAQQMAIQDRAIEAFGSYEPSKYDYRINEQGVLQRKRKE